MPQDPRHPPATVPWARVFEKLRELERRLDSIQKYFSGGASMQVPVVAALPTPGRQGRVVMLASDSKLYADNGAAWIAQT